MMQLVGQVALVTKLLELMMETHTSLHFITSLLIMSPLRHYSFSRVWCIINFLNL